MMWYGVVSIVSLSLAASLFAGPASMNLASEIDRVAREAASIRDKTGYPEAEQFIRDSAAKIIESAGDESDVGQTLTEAMKSAGELDKPELRVGRLNFGLTEAAVAANFKPKMEAPLADGFPEPGPVAVVVVKEYPAYRAARTPMPEGSDGPAFNRLFQHISTNDIPMTAPVEMVYDRSADKPAAGSTPKPVSMAFLYLNQEQGAVGSERAVEVVDLPAVTVLSVGVRGNYTDEGFARALTKIDAHLAANPGKFEVAGPPRVMGYNSPFILPALRFSEVQLPVRIVKK